MSNIDSRIRPAVPATAKMMDRMESHFSVEPLFRASCPVWRNHLSAAKDRSRKMVVTLLATQQRRDHAADDSKAGNAHQQPAMKSGFNPSAPMSVARSVVKESQARCGAHYLIYTCCKLVQ